jgi:NTE family protein
MALHALNLIIARQLVQDLESYQDKAQLTVIPPLCPQKTNPLDFRRSGDLIDQGCETTRTWLAAGGLEIERDYRFLLPHRH